MTSGAQFFPLQCGQISLQETSSPNLGEYIPFVLKIHDYKHHETWNVTVPSLANVRRWNTFLLYSFLLTQYPSSPSLSLAPFLNPLDGSGTTWHSSTTGALTIGLSTNYSREVKRRSLSTENSKQRNRKYRHLPGLVFRLWDPKFVIIDIEWLTLLQKECKDRS